MKIKHTEHLIHGTTLERSTEFSRAVEEIHYAISKVVWPDYTSTFNLNPTLKGNGVRPIKNLCMQHLVSVGWEIESRLSFGAGINPGPLDAAKTLSDGRIFALEWETGNISSSHRAINKMLLGIQNNIIAAGILVLPSRDMYKFLTDRIGNYQELSPYFPVYRHYVHSNSYLGVIEIEHDKLDTDSPLIPKGLDGMAKKDLI